MVTHVYTEAVSRTDSKITGKNETPGLNLDFHTLNFCLTQNVHMIIRLWIAFKMASFRE